MKRIFLLPFLLLFSSFVFSQFTLPTLPYSYDALEPYIDESTMYIHYNNHHAAYVNNLNNTLVNYPQWQKKDIADIMTDLNLLPEAVFTAVRNNGGGHYNHTLFWSMLAPAGSTKISAYVQKTLEENFESIDAFKSIFEKAATGRFGSGWVWLIKDKNDKLQIVSTPNQDNPLMPLAEVQGTPILALDVWEHAYYLKYQSKRAEYVKSFWNVVNWDEVEKKLRK